MNDIKDIKALLIVITGTLLGIFILILPVHAASEWTTENVYKAIATEAIGEGREGMGYVASALYNRRVHGLNMGSSGLSRPGVDAWLQKQPVRLLEHARQLADRVMYDENEFDTVNGATHFESTDFPTPSWVKDGSHVEVFRYKKHVFYKRS